MILQQMERIVASPPFRNSKRYPVLLRYLVEKTLRGGGESLKERTVGVDAFQRDPNYDTNADPIVRITAGEVRKRIAQYYHEDGREDELRIDLMPGTYVPVFRIRNEIPHERSEPPLTDPAAPKDGTLENLLAHPVSVRSQVPVWRRLNRFMAATIVLAVMVGTVAALKWYRTSSPPEGVWKPFTSATIPVLISIGEPRLAATPDLPTPNEPVTVRQHLFQVNDLTFSDVQALGQLTALLDRKAVPHRLQPASVTSFADMRQGPAILVGGLDNPWTLRVLSTKRFRFKRDPAGPSWIEDQKDPMSRRWLVDFSRPYAELTADYAIVARFVDSETGKPVMVVAGVGENGTKAASEFLTDPSAMRVFASESNVEIVLGTTVVKGVSGPPRVLAESIW